MALMQRLFFGGSFNPIHTGHLICARAVAEAAGFDQVVLLPSSQPPHKAGDKALASAAHRLEMCRAAVSSDPFFAVDSIELDRAGPSYTLDTVRVLRDRGEAAIAWLIGADMAASLPSWHRPIELVNEVRFVLMARPGWTFDWINMPTEFRKLQSCVIEAPLLQISSTDIRRRLSTGRSVRFLVPDSVLDYIQRHGLYAQPA